MADGTGVVVKRRWSREMKRRIVAESREPDTSVGEVAARYGVNASLVSVWRGQFGEAPAAHSAAGFIPVRVIDAAATAEGQRRHASTVDADESGWLRIMLADGTWLYISHAGQLPLLHGVLGMLRR